MKHTTAIALLCILAIGVLTSSPLRSNSTSRAGLVVVSGNGTVHTFCFDLGPDGQTTGAHLLLASGMEMVVQGDPATGMIVCKIGADGCDYPKETCFCDPVDYWSYWHLVNGAWSYSGTGASGHTVTHGDVDGWAWSQTMPSLTFQDICMASTTPIPLPTAAPSTPTATLVPSATPTPTPSATPTPTCTLVPTVTPSATPTAPPSVTPIATAIGTATVQATLTPTQIVSPTNVATAVSTSVVSPTVVLTTTLVVQTPTMTATSGQSDETTYPVYLPIITRGE